jgi:GNAT superfamily N-acetyltransferase
MKRSLLIRRYEHSDLDQVLQLNHTALESTGAAAGPGPWDDDLKRIPQVYFPMGDFLVGESGGRIIAMGATRMQSPNSAEIKRMRVAPEYQRAGLGQQILEALERRARELGFERLILDTTVEQAGAQQFYLKNAFREIGRGPLGKWSVIYYEKSISTRRSDSRYDQKLEERLEGGHYWSEVRRVGGTVRRPTGPWTPSVHWLLHYLADQGFTAAPRPLGIDDQGREILTFANGVLVQDHQSLTGSVEGLRRAVRLIRAFHDLSARLVGYIDGPWNEDYHDPAANPEIICHNDLAAWNLVAGDSGWTFIDWDLAAPGRRIWDLGTAVISFIPLFPSSQLGDDETAERLRLFSRTYGFSEGAESELLAAAVQRAQWEANILRTRGRAGVEPWASLLREGHGEVWASTAEHIQTHQDKWLTLA